MSEFDVVNNTKTPITTQTLLKEFRELGIVEGDIVLVHSSLSNIGWVCGSEVAVIQALLNAVGEMGTIVMPAHTGDNSEPSMWENPPVPAEWIETIRANMPAFHVDITPTRGMGRIAECFRKYPGTVRSNHPQVSFCAYGKYKNDVVRIHNLTPQFGMKTPLGSLYQLQAKVLLLGVGYYNCTCLHMAETMQENRERIKTAASISIDGRKQWIEFEDVKFNSDIFETIGLDYEKSTGNVHIGKVGNAICKTFALRPIVDYAAEWMKNH